MTRDETVHFYHHEQPYGCLSNYSHHPVYLDGEQWPTTEHFFHAQKFVEPHHQRAVRVAPTPGKAKREGRSRKRPLRPDWDAVKVEVMRRAVHAKAMQHADVRAVLLSTAPARLVERSDYDSFWGDGRHRDGKNMLGTLWTELRDALLADGRFDELADPLPPPWARYPELEHRSLGWGPDAGQAYADIWRAFYGGLTPAGRLRYRTELYPAPEEWADFYEKPGR